MKKLRLGAITVLALALTGCAMSKKNPASGNQAQSGGTQQQQQNAKVESENRDSEAFNRASALANGWPQTSIQATKEMVSKYGEPQETTSQELIWRNVAPFKKIVVHRTVYSSRFPLLHQNALEHVVDYKAPASKVDDIWNYNGSIVLDRTKGEMRSFADTEAMNILSLNLAHDIMSGKMSADAARVTYGKETMNFLNGKATADTSVLKFGGQWQTPDQGETITTKIRWQGDPANQRRPAQQNNVNTIQAQEEKKK